jgi:HK97 family phage portal protein
MAVLDCLIPPGKRAITRETLDEHIWEAFMGGSPTTSGERVNESLALALPAYYACIRAISEDVAKVPLPLYRRLPDGGKQRVPEHPVYKLIHDSPHEAYGAMVFWQTLMHHALGWGNGLAYLWRQPGTGDVLGMQLLNPSRMEYLDEGGGVLYRYTTSDGAQQTFTPREIFHLQGLGFDGVQGYSPAAIGREAVGLGLAAQKAGGALFGNNSRPGMALTLPAAMEPEAKKNFKKSFSAEFAKAENFNKTAYLEEGITLSTFGIPNKDAQWLESRTFTVQEMARLIRIPPHKIQDLSHGTFTNILHQALEYVGDTLVPWMERITQEVWRKLLRPADRDKYFAEHLVEALLKGDMETQNKALQIMHRNGTLSGNEWRHLVNMNSIGPEGDVYVIEANMTTREALLKAAEEPEPELVVPGAPDAPEPPQEPEEGETDQERNENTINRLTKSHEPLLLGCYRRLYEVEGDKIKRAHKRANFNAWLDEFCEGHVEYVRGLLIPVVDAVCGAACAACGSSDTYAEEVAQQTALMAQSHIQNVRLYALTDGRNSSEWIAHEELENLAALMRRLIGGNHANPDT